MTALPRGRGTHSSLQKKQSGKRRVRSVICDVICVAWLRRLQEVNKQWNESPFIADNVDALSAEARDLLDRIFVLDPSQRITIPEIMRHPWCAHMPHHRHHVFSSV